MEIIDRNEAIAVTLLAVGILLFANPAYTQGQGGGANSVQVAGEIQPDTLGPQSVAQLNPNVTVLPVIEYERLNNESRSIFDTGRRGIYVIRQQSDADNAVLQSAVLYDGSVYLRRTQETEQGVELTYQDVSGELDSVLASTNLMSPEQSGAFRNATQSDGVSITGLNRALTVYDYVYDNETGTYYETTTETTDNATVFSATEVDSRTLIDPSFADTDGMDQEVRSAVVAAINGEEPVVTGDVRSSVQQNRLVRHDGGYYQLGFGEASVPITEAFGPLNFAGMGLGFLFLLAGGLMVRRVLKEKA